MMKRYVAPCADLLTVPSEEILALSFDLNAVGVADEFDFDTIFQSQE